MTTYYVKNGGDDAKDGLSDGNAWATVAKVNGSTFAAGDVVQFKCGGTWTERLIPPSGGSSLSNRVTYGSYSSGAKPILDGRATITGWAQTNATLQQSSGTPDDANGAQLGNSVYVAASFVANANYTATKVSVGLRKQVGAPFTSAVHCYIYSDTAAHPNVSLGEATATRQDLLGATTVYYDWDFTGIALTSGTTYWVVLKVTTQDGSNYAAQREKFIGSGALQTMFSDNGTSWVQADLAEGTFNIYKAGAVTNVWQASVAGWTKYVWFNETLGTEKTSIGALASAGDWFWNAGTLFVYATSDPSGQTIKAAADNGTPLLNIEDKSFITIQGLSCFGASGHALRAVAIAAAVSGISFLDCDAAYGAAAGPGFGGATSFGFTNGLISGCNVSYMAQAGIGLNANVSSTTISYNTVDHCGTHPLPGQFGWHGITLYGPASNNRPSGNIVEYNTITATYKNTSGGTVEGTGIQCDDNSTLTTLCGNVITGNQGAGIRLNASSSEVVVRNVVANNGGDGIALASANPVIYHNTFYGNNNGLASSVLQSGTIFKNNIVAESVVREADFGAGTTTGFVGNYNCFYHSAGGTFMRWANTDYNWADWKTNSSQDANSLNANPLFADATTSDFRLQLASTCRDAGVVIVGINDGTAGSTRYNNNAPDIGASEAEATNVYWIKPHRVKPLMGDATTN